MKIDDINKKNIHKVPEGYFDQLPQQIQARIAEQNATKKQFWLAYNLKYAIPIVLLLVVVAISIFNLSNESSPEELLAEVSTEELILYLEDSDMTTEELIEAIDYESIEIEFDNETDIIDNEELNDIEMEKLMNDYQEIDDLL